MKWNKDWYKCNRFGKNVCKMRYETLRHGREERREWFCGHLFWWERVLVRMCTRLTSFSVCIFQIHKIYYHSTIVPNRTMKFCCVCSECFNLMWMMRIDLCHLFHSNCVSWNTEWEKSSKAALVGIYSKLRLNCEKSFLVVCDTLQVYE